MAARKKAAKQQPVQIDPVAARLEFLAGLMMLPADAKEADKIAMAARAGLDAPTVARIFNKKIGAASKAISRARNS